MRDLFSEQGFLVTTFNCRGAGRSGGRSGASAQTETEDYESVVASVMSTAERASVPISKLYICVCPSDKLCLILGILYST